MYGNETLVKSYLAQAQIGPYLIVKDGTADGTVTPATAATDKPKGVSVPTITVPSGQRADVVLDGIAQVVLGGTVTRGDPITANATGQGVLAAPGAGVNNHIVGFAEVSGVANDVIPVRLARGVMQG